MKLKLLGALLLSSTQMVATAALVEPYSSQRSYEVVLKSANSEATSLVISTNVKQEGFGTQNFSTDYVKTCKAGVNQNTTTSMGRVTSGYQIKVWPQDRSLLLFSWSLRKLESMKEAIVDGCTVQIPKVEEFTGEQAMELDVGKIKEFTSNGYAVSIKRIQ